MLMYYLASVTMVSSLIREYASSYHAYAPVKVDPDHPPQAYDRGPSDYTGTLTTAILSYIILTLQMVEIYIFWEGILTVKANGRVGILTDNPFLNQNCLGQHRIHIDMCIRNTDIPSIYS